MGRAARAPGVAARGASAGTATAGAARPRPAARRVRRESRDARPRSPSPLRRARPGGDCAARADRRLRPLRLLPADVPDVLALARGDGLAARPHLPDGRARRRVDLAERHRRRALRPLPRLHGVRHRVPVRRAVRPADRADARLRRDALTAAGSVERLLRAAIFAVFPHRRRLRAALARSRKLPAPGPLARADADRAAVAASRIGRPSTCPATARRSRLLAGCVAERRLRRRERRDGARARRRGLRRRMSRASRAAAARCTPTAATARGRRGRARRSSARARAATTYVVTNAAGCGSTPEGSRRCSRDPSSTSRSCSRRSS